MTALDICCPACGLPVPDHGPIGIIWDHLSGRLVTRFASVQLTKKEADLFEVLLDQWPNTVTVDRLITRAWGAWDDNPADRNNVGVHISKLRAKLRDSGVLIHTSRGNGFRLEGPPPEDAI
jgi:DNA-binding response OmpR family regulator